MTDFASRFEASDGEPIVEGRGLLYRRYWMEVSEGDLLSLRFVSFATEYVQGLRLLAEHCKLVVERFSDKDLVLWSDTAPVLVELRIAAAERRARVGFINVWKDQKHQTMMYALTSAAMKVSVKSDGNIFLRCSDGSGTPDFDDLVMEIRREHAR